MLLVSLLNLALYQMPVPLLSPTSAFSLRLPPRLRGKRNYGNYSTLATADLQKKAVGGESPVYVLLVGSLILVNSIKRLLGSTWEDLFPEVL